MATRFWKLTVAIFVAFSLGGSSVQACPFCMAVPLTLSQELKGADAVVVAQLVALPARPAGADGAFAPGLGEPLEKSKFKVVEVLKGADLLKKVKQIDAVYLGDAPVGTQFIISGIDPKALSWSAPLEIKKRSREYINTLFKLPETGPDRLAFFQNYLEDEEEMLSRDAFDEFAQASYADVKTFAPRINYKQLLIWLNSPADQVSASHRRLYFTLLGVCGTEKDLPLLEKFLTAKDRQLKSGLDAIIGSYLAIKGPEGMKLIEELYLKNGDAEFTDTYAAIQAVRISQEAGIITKDKAAEAFHYMLDRPKMADLVIPDLARWQDWTVADRLVQLFVTADADSAWVRVPVLRYLQVCPTPEAKKELARLEMMDPTAAKSAQSFMLPGGAAIAPAPAESPAASDKPSGAKTGGAAGAPKKSDSNTSATSTSTGSTAKGG
jgi:hypothetical protein